MRELDAVYLFLTHHSRVSQAAAVTRIMCRWYKSSPSVCVSAITLLATTTTGPVFITDVSEFLVALQKNRIKYASLCENCLKAMSSIA